MKNVTPYLSSVNRWAIHGFLRREDVPKERVTLFVANEGEEKEYRKALEAQSHGRKQNWCFFLCTLGIFCVRDPRGRMYGFRYRCLESATAVSQLGLLFLVPACVRCIRHPKPRSFAHTSWGCIEAILSTNFFRQIPMW